MLSYGLCLMIFILFQGQLYWKLKLYKLTDKTFNQHYYINLFKRFKKINIICIYLIPVVFVLQLLLNNWTIKTENLFVLAIIANVFGILEHINYYNRQLMIDNIYDWRYLITNKKLKVASLKKDIEEKEI